MKLLYQSKLLEFAHSMPQCGVEQYSSSVTGRLLIEVDLLPAEVSDYIGFHEMKDERIKILPSLT